MKKKFLKIITVALAAVVLMTVLCSCNSLDEIKAHHAVWEDDSQQVIILNGKRYVLYEGDEDIFWAAHFNGWEPFFSDYRVTDKDIPDLISRYFGDDYLITNDGRVIQMYRYVPNTEIDTEKEINDRTDYFVIEDEFDETVENYRNLKNSILEYCFVSGYDDSGYPEYEFVDSNIKEIIEETVKYSYFCPSDEVDCACLFDLCKCDKQMNVIKDFGYIGKNDDGELVLCEYEYFTTYKIDKKYYEELETFIAENSNVSTGEVQLY